MVSAPGAAASICRRHRSHIVVVGRSAEGEDAEGQANEAATAEAIMVAIEATVGEVRARADHVARRGARQAAWRGRDSEIAAWRAPKFAWGAPPLLMVPPRPKLVAGGSPAVRRCKSSAGDCRCAKSYDGGCGDEILAHCFLLSVTEVMRSRLVTFGE